MKIFIAAGMIALGFSCSAHAVINTSLGKYENVIYNSVKQDTKGNKYFGSRYAFDNNISYAKQNNMAYAAYVGSKNIIEVTAFKKFTVFQLNGVVAANMFGDSKLGTMSSRSVVLSKELWKVGPINLSKGSGLKKTFWTTKDSSGKEIYSTYRSKTATFYLPIGPIPFTVNAGLAGTIGVSGLLQNRRTSELDLAFRYGPFSDLDAIAYAYVNLVVARGGAYADLTLIGAKQQVAANAVFSPSQGRAYLNFSLPGRINTLDGKVSLYGDVIAVKYCYYKVWGVKVWYPCGTYWKRAVNYVLASWGGYTYNWNLFNWTKEFI